MTRKTMSCLPKLLLALCFLTMSAFAQDATDIAPKVASRLAMLKEMRTKAVRDAHGQSGKAKQMKANDGGSAFQLLHTFTGGADGGSPYGGVNLDASGNLYGSTPGAGTTGDYGTLYKIDPAGNYSVLYVFQNGSDGSAPGMPPLPPDASGNMDGTAGSGGAGGSGALFQFVPETSTFNPLVAFGSPSDATHGYGPGGLISDSSGNLYGFTVVGGDFGNGNVYEAPNGNLTNPTNLYSFTGNADGSLPQYGTVLMDASGNLYGTTSDGGSITVGNVYELSLPSGNGCPANSYQNDSDWCESVLYSFDSFDFPNDVAFPFSGVAMDASGSLYGTGNVGGAYNEAGGVWKLTPVSLEPGGVCPAGSNQDAGSSWCETVLHNFCSALDGDGICTDGMNPLATVVLDRAGNLYGVTQNGGAGNYLGVLYEISAGGQFTVLHDFDGVTDGDQPYGTPVLSPSGTTLYGTTFSGGGGNQNGLGTVWFYQLPQPQSISFTSFIPTEAKRNDTFTVTASATSGLPVALTASGVCTVPSGSVSPATYTMTSNTGICSVIANQPGNSSFLPAPQISQTVQAVARVTLLAPTTSLTSTVISAPYQSTFTVTATSNSTGVLTITATPSSICSITGTTVTMNRGTGTCTVTAKWAANEYFAAASATPVEVGATPLAGTIDWPTPAPITYGTALSSAQLDASSPNSAGKLIYSPNPGKVLAAGLQILSVTLDSTKDYTGTTATVPLRVNQSTTTTTVNGATVGSSYLKATVTFTTAGQNGGQLTGAVTVTATTGEFCKASPAIGSCTITFKRTSAGTTETLTAVYPGDANNIGSNGTGSYTVPTSGGN